MGRDLFLETDSDVGVLPYSSFSASDGRQLRDLIESGGVDRLEECFGLDLSFLKHYDTDLDDIDEVEQREDWEPAEEELRGRVADTGQPGVFPGTSPAAALKTLDALLQRFGPFGKELPTGLVGELSGAGHDRTYIGFGGLFHDLSDLRRGVEVTAELGARRVRLAIW